MQNNGFQPLADGSRVPELQRSFVPTHRRQGALDRWSQGPREEGLDGERDSFKKKRGIKKEEQDCYQLCICCNCILFFFVAALQDLYIEPYLYLTQSPRRLVCVQLQAMCFYLSSPLFKTHTRRPIPVEEVVRSGASLLLVVVGKEAKESM